MGFFNFFGDNEHRVFNYKPMYYDKEKEERMRKFRAVDGSMEHKDEEGKSEYVPGSYIKGAFRDGAYQHTRNRMKGVQTIIGIVTLLLIVAVLFFIAKFYSML
jgi:CRISPR/Cas system CSM-associated protein Csm5 (group 7 of RAMP superfamily)